MSAIYYKTSDTVTPLFEILPLESNGPGNLSVPRQIVDVEFLDKSFATPTDAFIVNDDVSARFVQGFTFNVIGSGKYDGSYVVNGGAFAPGAPVAQVIDGKTHIPVAEVDITATSTPYVFRTGFVTPLISPTTPHNYLVTWEVAGDMTTLVSVNDTIQIKHFLYNGTRVNRVYTVSSVTLDAGGTFTRIITLLSDDAVSTPVIGVDSQSVLVTPVPTPVVFGYVQYTVANSATSLRIVGKGVPAFNETLTWGNAVQTNLIHMLENFAHTVEPVSPMTGQLWFDTNLTGPALQLRNGASWHGVVASGLPVQGDVNMNGHTVANVADATTTYPYGASTSGWGTNGQEVLNLRTSDALYISKTGGYDTTAANRSGTMTGVLSVTPHVEIRSALTTSVGTTGRLRLGDAAEVGMSLKSNSTTFAYVDFVNASNQVSNVTYTFGTKLLEFGKYVDGVANPAAVTLNFSTGQVLTKKTSFTDNQELITKLFADTTYINVAGDTMTGALTLNADPINALHAATKQYVDNTTVSLSGDTMTGALVLNADPTAAMQAATKQYVDAYVSGIIWVTPVYDPNLFDDSLSAPPTVDTYTAFHKSYIVAGVGTGAWTGFDGHLMVWDGAAWQSILGRPVAIGDRFGVFVEPHSQDPMVALPGGGLATHAGQLATVTGVSPYTYTFYTPTEPDAVSVKGIVGNAAAYQSPHMGHGYTFRGTYGVGSYGTGYSWIEFSSSPSSSLSYFSEARSSTAPNNTVPVHSFTTIGTEANIDVSLVPKGLGALLTSVPDGTIAGGNKRGSQAIDLQLNRQAVTNVASGDYSVLIGGFGNTASGQESVSIGGADNLASALYTTVVGSESNSATEVGASVLGSFQSSVSGAWSYVVGGSGATITGNYSGALGGDNAQDLGLDNKIVYGGGSVFAGVNKYTQWGIQVLATSTTDATPKVLRTSNDFALDATNITVLKDNSVFEFKTTITAFEHATTDTKVWTITGVVKRGVGVATTAFVGTPVTTVVAADAGAAAWTVAASVDNTTYGALQFTATGEAAHTITWNAKVETTEIF